MTAFAWQLQFYVAPQEQIELPRADYWRKIAGGQVGSMTICDTGAIPGRPRLRPHGFRG